jgi:uncharacterized integral membrane protein
MKLLKRWKLFLIATLLILIVVVILQNTEAVRTEILFFSVTLPRALLLSVTTALGFAMGLVVAARSSREKKAD